MPTNTLYTATKTAVRSFMDGLVFDLNIQQLENCIKTTTAFPYFIDTQEGVAKYVNDQVKSTFILDQQYTAHEIVKAVLYDTESIVLPKPFSFVKIM